MFAYTFEVRPSYRELDGLSIPEQHRRLRDPALRRRILDEKPSAEEVSRLAQFRAVACAQRAPDLDHPLRAHAQEAAERHELRRRRPLELGQLGDVARLHQLAEPRLDPGPDPDLG